MAIFNFKAATAMAMVSFALTSPADAFWRMPCRARSGLARLDPLVNFGSLSDHAHYIHGSDGFSETSSTDALLDGSCTSCEVEQDKSAYWTPAVYFKSTAGEYTLVEQVGGMLVYYLLYTNAGNTSLSAFPKNFDMIAGDTLLRNFSYPIPDVQKSLWYEAPYNTQAFLRQAAVGFNCLNYAKTAEGSLYRHFMPSKTYIDENCADGIRLELMFPSCWNGVDLTSSDKKSHVAYPSQVMTGDCPSDFPIRLPSMFYETIVNTPAFDGQDGTFVFSNGDETGFGYHGDFIMGWEESFLQSAVDTCTNASGQVEDCAIFTIQDSSTYSNCNFTLPSALENDDVVGPRQSLPGNVTIQYGPAYATKAGSDAGSTVSTATATAVATAALSSLSYHAGSSLASTETFQQQVGAIFDVVSTGASYSPSSSSATTSSVSIPATLAAAAADEPVITSAPVAATVEDDEEFFTTEYRTTGQVVYEVVWAKTEVTVTASTTITVSASASGNVVKRHLHKHARHAHR